MYFTNFVPYFLFLGVLGVLGFRFWEIWSFGNVKVLGENLGFHVVLWEVLPSH